MPPPVFRTKTRRFVMGLTFVRRPPKKTCVGLRFVFFVVLSR